MRAEGEAPLFLGKDGRVGAPSGVCMQLSSIISPARGGGERPGQAESACWRPRPGQRWRLQRLRTGAPRQPHLRVSAPKATRLAGWFERRALIG